MPLKQAAFNFDFDPAPPPPAEEKQVLKRPAPEEIMVKEEAHAVNQKKSTRGRMKISEMSASVHRVEVPEDAILFEKSYYSIGAVSEMFKVNPSLLRFWESEFSILKPKKNGKGDRFFRPQDVKNLQLIYHLLRERKYTIEGAKDYLKKSARAEEKFAMIESLKRLKQFLAELKTTL